MASIAPGRSKGSLVQIPEPGVEETSAVTQTNPEKLAGAPGRVLFSLRAGHPGMGSSRDRGPRPIKTEGT